MSGDTEFSIDFSDILNGGSEGLNRFKKTNAALPSKTGRIGENNWVLTKKTRKNVAAEITRHIHTWDVGRSETQKDVEGRGGT